METQEDEQPQPSAREACSAWADIISANADAYVRRLILQTHAEAARAVFLPISLETTA